MWHDLILELQKAAMSAPGVVGAHVAVFPVSADAATLVLSITEDSGEEFAVVFEAERKATGNGERRCS